MTHEWSHALSRSASNLAPAPTFLAMAGMADVISLAGGVPDPVAFPFSAISEAMNEILSDPGKRVRAFQYAPSAGYEPLRQLLAQRMNSEGTKADPDRLLITNGAQQALDLVARLLVDAGDAIAVTAPTFFAAIDTFSAYRPTVLSIPFGQEGIDLDSARRHLSKRPKFLYLIPEFQNPTGLCIGLEERQSLLDMCVEYDVPIIEDVAYRELRFEGKDIPTISSLAQRAGFGNHVLQVNTFSKTIAPGLRVGWVYGAPTFIAKLAALKLAADVHTSVFNQMIASTVAANALPHYLPELRGLYRKKRDVILNALEHSMPDGCRWNAPAGGLFVWLSLPQGVTATELLRQSMETIKVAFVPGKLFYADRSRDSECRLSYATLPGETTERGIAALGDTIRDRLTGHPSRRNASVGGRP